MGGFARSTNKSYLKKRPLAPQLRDAVTGKGLRRKRRHRCSYSITGTAAETFRLGATFGWLEAPPKVVSTALTIESNGFVTI